MGMENMGGGHINESGEFIRGNDAPEREKAVEFDSFESLYKDPVAKSILEKVSLEYLQTQDKDYFDKEFTGELDSDGYLIKKDGSNSNTTPSMNITGPGMQWVMDKVKAEMGQ